MNRRRVEEAAKQKRSRRKEDELERPRRSEAKGERGDDVVMDSYSVPVDSVVGTLESREVVERRASRERCVWKAKKAESERDTEKEEGRKGTRRLRVGWQVVRRSDQREASPVDPTCAVLQPHWEGRASGCASVDLDLDLVMVKWPLFCVVLVLLHTKGRRELVLYESRSYPKWQGGFSECRERLFDWLSVHYIKRTVGPPILLGIRRPRRGSNTSSSLPTRRADRTEEDGGIRVMQCFSFQYRLQTICQGSGNGVAL